jgi:hypothetical protein
LTSSLGLVWLLANLLILLSLPPKLPYCQIPCFLIPHGFVKSWVLFNISPLRDQISALLLTEFVSLCMLLQILFGLPLNAFCVIFGVRHPMTYISLAVPPLLYMVLQMRIGHVVLMIASLRVITFFFLIKRWFHENQVSNTQLPTPLRRLSIKP